MKKKKAKILCIGIIIFLLGGLCSFATLRIMQEKGSFRFGKITVSGEEYGRLKDIEKRYEKAETLIGIINKYYYTDVKAEDINEGIYRGLVAGLGDKYSAYMSKKEYSFYESSIKGEFDGVGVTITQNKKNQIEVVNTIEDSPAAKGGVRKGDIIYRVDGKHYEELDNAVMAMRGKKGSKVDLDLDRNGKHIHVTLYRAKIVNHTVSHKMLKGNIGYIQIKAFEEATDKDFKKAIEDFENKNAKGLIVDLRDNGGGLVSSGVNVADELMGKGVVTFTKDRKGKKEYYRSDSKKTDLPYVLLVNGNTASASEIISGAIKDSGEGKIVGTKTFGKGVIQISIPIGDGSGIKLTIMQYFSPKGKTIHKKGIVPDYIVNGKNNQLKKAVEILK